MGMEEEEEGGASRSKITIFEKSERRRRRDVTGEVGAGRTDGRDDADPCCSISTAPPAPPTSPLF